MAKAKENERSENKSESSGALERAALGAIGGGIVATVVFGPQAASAGAKAGAVLAGGAGDGDVSGGLI